jgi:hypothetical protein
VDQARLRVIEGQLVPAELPVDPMAFPSRVCGGVRRLVERTGVRGHDRRRVPRQAVTDDLPPRRNGMRPAPERPPRP